MPCVWEERELRIILQCADISQAAEHSYSQMCDLIVTQVKSLHETETRKHPILQTTQMVKGQIPGTETQKDQAWRVFLHS